MMKRPAGPIRLLLDLMLIMGMVQAMVLAGLPLLPEMPTVWRASLLHVSLLLLLAGPLVYWRSMVMAQSLRTAARSAEQAQQRSGLAFGRAVALTGTAQALGLVATAGAVWYLQGTLDQAEKIQFDQSTARIKTELMHRLTQPMYGLAGLRSSYAVKQVSGNTAPLTQVEFEAAIGTRDLSREFPGVRAFSFVERVQRADLDAFVQRMQAQWGPRFAVRSAGSAADLLVVSQVAPLEPNRAALGFDTGQEPVRREAAERAMATGQAALSGPITFLMDATQPTGFLVFLPVYRSGTLPTEVGGRAGDLLGLVFAPVAANALFLNTREVAGSNLQFAVYDGSTLTPSSLVYDDAAPRPGAPEVSAERSVSPAKPGNVWKPKFQSDEVLHVGGRLLTVRLQSTHEFESAQDRSSLVATALGGTAVSFLMALSVWLLSAGRMRAQNLAARMTVDLDRLARVARHTNSVVLLVDAGGSISWVNEGFTRLTGRTLDEVKATPALSLIRHDLTPYDTLERLTQCARQGHAFRGSVVVSGADQRDLWLDLELQPNHDALGHFSGYMQIGNDITARKSTEMALKASEAFLDRAGHIAGVGGWHIDIATGKITWSKVTKQIHEVPEDYQPDLASAINFYAPEARPIIEQAVKIGISEGKGWDMELPFITATGRPIWVRALGEVEYADGNPVALVGAFQDITQRRLRDENLLLLESCVSRINDSILITKANVADWLGPEIVFANPAFETLTGFSIPEVMGKTPRILQGEDTDRAELSKIKAALLRGESLRTELLNYTKDGHPYWIEIDISPVKSEAGEITHFVAVERDVTERRDQAAALRDAVLRAEQATASKGQFLANMSHEIRTPMNAIIGMLALLHRTDLTPQQLDYAEKSQNAAHSLLGLINDILDFSKVEAGKMTLDPQPFTVSKLMRDLAVILSANAGTKGIDVLFDIDSRLPPVLLGDAMRLQQILINLGGNAVKFTAAGQVVVSVSLQHVADGMAHVDFAVKDSGIGIAPENQHKIFAGFSQAEASTTRKFGGTGLGLAISRHMIEIMGGELVLTSAVGEGSVFAFTLVLPVVTEVSEDLVVVPRPSGAPLRVLVVDDNPVACDLTVRMATSWNWLAEGVLSGEGALALIDERMGQGGFPFDVVVLDWHLPGIDGWEVAKSVRALHARAAQAAQQPSLPLAIIMVTASSRESLSQRTEAEQALLNGFLVKPLTASTLLDAILQAGSPKVGIRTGRRPAASQRRLNGMRILVVEDNQINQQVAEELLNSEGANVSLAANGQLGVDAVRFATPQFDAVLMDIQMPVMDGFTATRVIREHLGFMDLPIIAMTANAMNSDRDDCLAAGMNAHVGKPFELSALVKTLLSASGYGVPVGASWSVPASPSMGLGATTPPKAAAVSGHTGGIDLGSALARLSGMESLYLRAAKEFVKVLPTVMMEFRQLLETDRKQATMQMHTLKGNSALLGATALAEVTGQLEAQCKSSVSTGEIAAQIPHLERTLHACGIDLQAVIVQLGAAEPLGPAALPSVTGTGGLHARLVELGTLLANGDLEALSLFAQLRPQFPADLQAELNSLEEALQDLELEAARIHCLALIANLGIANGRSTP